MYFYPLLLLQSMSGFTFDRSLCETSQLESSNNLNNSFCSLENSSGLCSLDTNDRTYIFTGLSVATILVSFARAFGFVYVCVNASRVLHNRMFGAVLRSPVLFFDTNPIGKFFLKSG